MDYRNSSYCEELSNLTEKKLSLLNNMRETNCPRTENHYSIVSSNNPKYKDHRREFTEIYNKKCYYCGVPFPNILPKDNFQIDHYVGKKNDEEKNNNFSNLVLACKNCNSWKSNFDITIIPELLNPDDNNIKNCFHRASDYSIIISEQYEDVEVVCEFYKKLRLDNEFRRLDYLLMEIDGLLDKCKSQLSSNSIIELYETKDMLLKKRNG